MSAVCHQRQAKTGDLVEVVFLDKDQSLQRRLFKRPPRRGDRSTANRTESGASQDGEKEALAQFEALGGADLVLDLHHVLDTVDVAAPLFSTPTGLRAACCSYVGRYSHLMREEAVEQIEARMRSGQLAWGALVFARDRFGSLCTVRAGGAVCLLAHKGFRSWTVFLVLCETETPVCSMRLDRKHGFAKQFGPSISWTMLMTTLRL